MGETILGFIFGILVATPIVFLITAIAAASVWKCKPCKDGEPIR